MMIRKVYNVRFDFYHLKPYTWDATDGQYSKKFGQTDIYIYMCIYIYIYI